MPDINNIYGPNHGSDRIKGYNQGAYKMNKLTADHTIDSMYLQAERFFSPINQPMADVEAEPKQTKNALAWLMRFTESYHQAWRQNGCQSYGL